MADKKRRMILVPAVNPHSFVFFFEKGESGNAWSIRDYSTPQRVVQYGPHDFNWTVEEILRQASRVLDAPTHRTTDMEFWHQHTCECNQRTLGSPSGPASASPVRRSAFPTLNLPLLLAHPKGRKRQDMDRILHSPNSEDWVTWNFFQLLLAHCPASWWSHLLTAARLRNSALTFPFEAFGPPTARFWSSVSAPAEYLALRRAQTLSPKASEGASEIDIVFDHDRFLVFAEAKLGSDISLRTTYDTQRNQIIRNIDCLIGCAGGRTPIFWMFVRDQAPDRAYVQLMNSYRSDPDLLLRDLPHRDPETLRGIARNLTMLQWSDFRQLISGPAPVQQELDRRIAG